jgi:hypothetical protein
MWEDPIVADVRRAREELSARFNFDVTAIFADIRKRQAALGSRLVSPTKCAEQQDAGERAFTRELYPASRSPAA